MVVASCLRFCSLQVVPLVAPSIEPGPTVKAHVHTKEEPKQAGQIHVEDPTLTALSGEASVDAVPISIGKCPGEKPKEI